MVKTEMYAIERKISDEDLNRLIKSLERSTRILKKLLFIRYRYDGDKGVGFKSYIHYILGGCNNASIGECIPKSRGSPARTRIVRRFGETSENKWKEFVRLGKRSNVEIYFTGLRRTMLEAINSVRSVYPGQGYSLKRIHFCQFEEV